MSIGWVNRRQYRDKDFPEVNSRIASSLCEFAPRLV